MRNGGGTFGPAGQDFLDVVSLRLSEAVWPRGGEEYSSLLLIVLLEMFLRSSSFRASLMND